MDPLVTRLIDLQLARVMRHCDAALLMVSGTNTLSEYELAHINRVKANQEVLRSLGIENWTCASLMTTSHACQAPGSSFYCYSTWLADGFIGAMSSKRKVRTIRCPW